MRETLQTRRSWRRWAGLALARGLELGPDGVFAAIAVAYATMSAAALVVFRRGRWKLAVV